MVAISIARNRYPGQGPGRGGSSMRSVLLEPISRGLAGSLATRVGKTCAHLLDRRRARRDIRRLEMLDDRMLRDIGLTRTEIASAVYGRAVGERNSRARS